MADPHRPSDLHVQAVTDWQIVNGLVLKSSAISGRARGPYYPVNVTLQPSKFPKKRFYEATQLQMDLNCLYARVSSDEDWLRTALSSVLGWGTLPRRLMDIHDEVKKAGFVQRLSLGIFRSDYMLQAGANTDEMPTLKQVEFNTIAATGGTHCKKVSDMHRQLCKTVPSDAMPENDTPNSIVRAIKIAHDMYVNDRKADNRRLGATMRKAADNRPFGVMMVVQPNNFNVCDERPIEYGLTSAGVPCHRVDWGSPAFVQTSLGHDKQLLLMGEASHIEISVVYFRAGYRLEEYDDVGVKLRYRLEASLAIKCPSILGHLSTMKMVQQKLSEPDHLSHFLLPETCEKVLAVCAPMHPMTGSTEAGRKGCKLATEPETAKNHVLKPCLEGGDNNVYGPAIPDYLNQMNPGLWKEHILMELITPPKVEGALFIRSRNESRHKQVNVGPVVNELGVFGSCMWLVNEPSQGSGKCSLLRNDYVGFSMRTKPADKDEMNVVKGYGCFDSPWLT